MGSGRTEGGESRVEPPSLNQNVDPPPPFCQVDVDVTII
jgi:hypothetical protein